MPAAVKLQAYPDAEFQGRLREIFPSADRAKAIVEVRVTILEPTRREAGDDRQRHVPGAAAARAGDATPADAQAGAGIVLSKRAVVERSEQTRRCGS